MEDLQKEDIEKLTDEQLRLFYTLEDVEKMPKPIRSYILDGKEIYDMSRRHNHIEKLANDIVIRRFIAHRPAKEIHSSEKPMYTRWSGRR